MMKPNDKAIEAAILAIKENGPYYAGSKIRESMAKHLAEVALPPAYAAQFQIEDYAGLIKKLRSERGCIASPDDCLAAADAIETVLAERDALNSEIKTICERESTVVDVGFELKAQNDQLRAERDALLARLQAAADRIEKLAGDMRPPNNITPQLFMLANSIKQNAQQSGRNARLAPVDDEALVEIGAKAMARPPFYQWEEMSDTNRQRTKMACRAAIAAIRPHIEAAERERCAKIAEEWSASVFGDSFDEKHVTEICNSIPPNIAAAIRRTA